MKPWQLNRRVNSLSQDLSDPVKTETRIDFSCLTEPERELFNKVREIMDKYAPGGPPQDVIVKNADLWNKGLEIFARRSVELFVEVLPRLSAVMSLKSGTLSCISTISGLTGWKA